MPRHQISARDYASELADLHTHQPAIPHPTQGHAEPAAGGEFSLFGGAIHGRGIECLPGTRLVQAWRASTWDDGVYSVVRFELASEGSKTKVVLDHAGFRTARASTSTRAGTRTTGSRWPADSRNGRDPAQDVWRAGSWRS